LREDKIWLWIFCLFVLVGTSIAEEDQEESPFLTGQSLKWSGYTQIKYTYWEEGANEFRIRRARLGLKGEIHKNIHLKLQVDAVKRPVLLDAQIGICFSPQVELRFGQYKVPFSLENLTSSSALDTINRSQTVENLSPGRDIRAAGRDIGISLNGRFSWVEYDIGIFNGSGINKVDTNDRRDIAGRLVFYPVRSLALGLSVYNGRSDSQNDGPIVKRNRTGLEIFYVYEKLSVKGEYIFARDDRTEKYGWYMQGGYDLIPERIQAVIKYESFDKNMDVTGDRIKVITFGLNCFFSKNTLLQVNYEYHREEKNTTENAILVQFQAGF